MAWLTISVDDVKTRLTGAELSAVQSAALAEGQTDPLPEIVGQVVDEMRGYMAAGGVTLGESGTIPKKLLGASLAIIRYRLATRLPVKSLLTEQRVAENRDALALLDRVASGRFLVEEPETEDTEVTGSPAPSINPKTRGYSRDDQDGI